MKSFSSLFSLVVGSVILAASAAASAQSIDFANAQPGNYVPVRVEAPQPAQTPDRVEGREPGTIPEHPDSSDRP